MIGISVYLSKENEEFNQKWIEKTAKNGFSSIFTSLHIPEDDTKLYKELLIQLGREAKKHQMDLFADISPKSFEYLKIDINDIDQLLEWGITGLRVDYGLSVEEIVQLSKKMKISLNASTLTEKFLKELIDKGLNTSHTEAAHNFYPRPETGLSREYFIKKNQLLKKYQIKISAFIPGDGIKRKPLYQGLPTLEEHRDTSSVQAYLDLKKNGFVDTVYIGDPSLTDETLEKFTLLSQRIIPIRYRGENNPEFSVLHTYLEGVQSNRPDPARDVIRLGRSRIDLHDKVQLDPIHTTKRKKGSVTIDNDNYGRYAGEIQITLIDLKQDDKVNVLGEVIQQDMPLLDFIEEGSQILLQKVK
ncbi:DUF871 domain-containing protein [Oceanobacillus jeddahense]|uniref:DUF871 domain-containing protein n=1 Tax=Oceanobacillus jeddahense TaxID=1462527 RepID=UPI0005963747|nr:MupG family TIM beta-alpha barrel fold protein [Oceanobacillus jeddahense]